MLFRFEQLAGEVIRGTPPRRRIAGIGRHIHLSTDVNQSGEGRESAERDSPEGNRKLNSGIILIKRGVLTRGNINRGE